MKLDVIKKEQILLAAEKIDNDGLPKDNVFNNYYVVVGKGKEYPFKELVRIAYQFTEGNEGKILKFESNSSYRQYIRDLGFDFKFYKENINFFEGNDLELMESFGGKPYRSASNEDKRKARLLLPLVKKLNVWGKRVIYDDFTAREDNGWQWSGTFRSYLWVRLFRKEASQKVFFIVGVTNNGGLFIKLDCLHSNHTKGSAAILSKGHTDAFDNYLSEVNYRELFISKEQLKKFNWDTLIEYTQEYMKLYEVYYDDLENLISNEITIISKSNIINFQEIPTKTNSFQKKKRTFVGKDIDWEQKGKSHQRSGNAGERLVELIEKEKLKNWGMENLADKVCKKQDGVGYDILSFNKKGKEIFIEVKTTTGSDNQPFYMSANEKAYFENHPENYYLYRIYNYSFSNNTGDCYILTASNLNDKAEFNSTQFEVSF